MSSIYADGFSIMTGLTDTKIDFLAINPVTNEKGEVIGEQRTPEQRIILSLPLAKELAEKLSEMIVMYEAQFGTVLDLKAAREKMEKNG